mmetsp:Transcript_5614/g.17666  ORF Transcript_5614/g.17666 Transcript_5614/m.17666 type:complete len:268 (-) Transcript_5614:624-1427(-)
MSLRLGRWATVRRSPSSSRAVLGQGSRRCSSMRPSAARRPSSSRAAGSRPWCTRPARATSPRYSRTARPAPARRIRSWGPGSACRSLRTTSCWTTRVDCRTAVTSWLRMRAARRSADRACCRGPCSSSSRSCKLSAARRAPCAPPSWRSTTRRSSTCSTPRPRSSTCTRSLRRSRASTCPGSRAWSAASRGGCCTPCDRGRLRGTLAATPVVVTPLARTQSSRSSCRPPPAAGPEGGWFLRTWLDPSASSACRALASRRRPTSTSRC